ncbi:MAG: hypothetical protein ACTSW1_13115 [Candidatus Hodarchaeales archaeon]
MKIKTEKKYWYMKKRKSDPGYLKRIIQRYQDIRENAEIYAKYTEEEMFKAYLDFMNLVFQLHNAGLEDQ